MKKPENGGSTVSAHEHSNWCLPLLIFSIDSKCFIEFFRNHHMTTFFCCRLSLFPPTQKCCLRKSLILVEMDLWGDRSNDSPSLLHCVSQGVSFASKLSEIHLLTWQIQTNAEEYWFPLLPYDSPWLEIGSIFYQSDAWYIQPTS